MRLVLVAGLLSSTRVGLFFFAACCKLRAFLFEFCCRSATVPTCFQFSNSGCMNVCTALRHNFKKFYVENKNQAQFFYVTERNFLKKNALLNLCPPF